MTLFPFDGKYGNVHNYIEKQRNYHCGGLEITTPRTMEFEELGVVVVKVCNII